MRPERIVRVVGPNRRRSSAGACAGVGSARAAGATISTCAGAATSSGMLVAAAAGAYNSLGTGAAAGSSTLSAVILGAATSTGAAAGSASASGAGATITRGSGAASGVGVATGSADGSEPIAPTILGMNTDEAWSYSYSDIVRDKCTQGRWFYRNSSTGVTTAATLNAAGWPVGPIPGGYNTVYCLIFEGTKGTGRTGLWAVVPDRACTMSFAATSNATPGTITTTKALITTGATGGFTAGVQFAGFTLGSDEQFSAMCKLDSDTAPGAELVNAQAAADWSAAQFGPNGFVWRDMKYTGSEDAATTPAYRAFATPAFAASFQQQTGADVWHTIAWSENLNTVTRPFLEYWRDNTPSTAIIYGEVANEVWNNGYNIQFGTMAAAAFNAGHWASGTIPGGTTVTNEYYPTTTVSPVNGTTSRIFQPGEWFYCRSGSGGSTYQHLLVEVTAATAVAAGAVVPITGSANGFTVRGIYTNIHDTLRRYQTALQISYAQLGYEVLGNRFKSVLGVGYIDSVANISSWIRYLSGHLYIDHYANSGYSGTGASFASLPWAASYASDFAAFKAGFFIKRRAQTDVMIANRVATKNGVWSQLAAAGIVAADRPTQIYYETGDHNTIRSVPAADQAGVAAAVKLCRQSAEEYTETMYHLTEMRDKLGGVNILFVGVEEPFWNSGASQVQGFGWLMNQRGERSGEQTYNALLDFAATL